MTIDSHISTHKLFNGTGSSFDYPYPFPNSFEDDDVIVYVWNATTSVWDQKTKDSDYTQANNIITGTFTSGTNNVLLTRKTDVKSPKVDYQPGSSIRAQDLDNNQTQVLQRLQELEDATLSNTHGKLKGNLDLNNFNITQDGEAISNLHVSDEAPSTPANGTRWFDTNSGRTYIYYTDVDSSAWVDTTPTYVQVGTSDEALPKAGGTMTGTLTLSGAPTSTLHAATKAYVDAVSGLTDGDKGDITVSASGATWNIDDNAVDAAALADNAVDTAAVSDNAVTLAKLEDGTQGDILYYAASGAPTRLAKAGAGKVLKMNAGNTAPEWSTVSGSGTVTEIIAGTGLTGGTIDTSGTIAADVGTSAGKIVQLDGSAKLPAVDGSNLTNVSTTVADNAVTTAKISNNAVDGTKIAIGSDAAGDILYNNGTDYTRLAKPGTPDGEVLTFANGASAPSWAAAGGTFRLGAEMTLSPDRTKARDITDRLADAVHLEDFTADDGSTTIVKGATVTNAQMTTNTQVFQNALNAQKTVIVPRGSWFINDTLIISKSNTGLIGEQSLGTKIKLVVANKNTHKPAIKLQANSTGVGDTDGAAIEYCRLEDLYIQKYVQGAATGADATLQTPDNLPSALTSDHAGVAFDGNNYYKYPTGSTTSTKQAGGVERPRIYNLRVGHFVTGFYFSQVVGLNIRDCLAQQLETHGSNTTDTGYSTGYHFEADVATTGAMSPLASINVINCKHDGSGYQDWSSANTSNFFLDGNDLRDIFLVNPEGVKVKYGIWVKSSNNQDNWDIHIQRPIIDAYLKEGIRIEGCDGASGIHINGGYVCPRSSNDANVSPASGLHILDSSGVTVTGLQCVQATSDTADDNGILLTNSHSCNLTGNRILNAYWGISLNNSTYNSLVGNLVGAAAITSGTAHSSYTIRDAIRLYGGSQNNTLIGNIVKRSSNATWDDGIVFSGSTTTNNVGYGNKIDAENNGRQQNNATGNELDPGGSSGSSDSYMPLYASSSDSDTKIYSPSDNNIQVNCGGTNRIYQKSGFTLIGGNNTSTWDNVSSATVQIDGGGAAGLAIKGGSTSGQSRVSFFNPNGRVGYIATSGSGTTYYTSSDYRLKENQVPIVGALSKLLQLKPYTFNWKVDPKTQVTGFFAHEAQEVLPEAVDGEKDSQNMQAVDYSKFVPLLTAAVQELTARLEALENN